MSARPQTTFAGGVSPFPTAPKTPRRKAPAVDVDTLKVMRAEPLPEGRSAVPHKYHAVFSKLQPGDAIKCQPFQVGTVAKALNHWLKDRKQSGLVRSCRHYPADGLGRVWLLEAPKGAGRKGGGA